MSFGEIRGGGWVRPKDADSMAISGLSFRNTLVGSRWATAVLLCMNGLRNCPLTLHGAPFQWEDFFPSLVSGCRLSAVTIASSLISGFGFSHEHVGHGRKSACVKFAAENATELGLC